MVGMADTQLHKTRVTIAYASSPAGRGKNIDIIFWLIDGPSGTLDPAFDANAQPIWHWASAVWEQWRSSYILGDSFAIAQEKVDNRGATWRSAAGPVMALHLTFKRLQWTAVSHFIVVSDSGRCLDFRLDSPAAVLTEAREAVRRWRWRRIMKAFPQMTPAEPDITAIKSDEGPTKVHFYDFAKEAHQVIKGKGQKKNLQEWDMCYVPSLISAVSGGQWTQARMASVKEWTNDAACQLCHEATGTLLHRHEC